MRVDKTGARAAVCGVESVVCVAVALWTQSPDADYLVAHKIVSIKKPDPTADRAVMLSQHQKSRVDAS